MLEWILFGLLCYGMGVVTVVGVVLLILRFLLRALKSPQRRPPKLRRDKKQ